MGYELGILEPEARAFVDDVDRLKREYSVEAAPLTARLEGLAAELEQLRYKAAQEERECRAEISKLNDKYRALVVGAAERRAAGAENPGEIRAGVSLVSPSIGGIGGDSVCFNETAFYSPVIEATRARREREEMEQAEKSCKLRAMVF